MTLVAQIGDVVQTRGEVTFEWSIHDFFSLTVKVDGFYKSPVFNFADSRWYLKLYPNGQTRSSSCGWLSLYLVREDSGPPRTIHYTLGVKSRDGDDMLDKVKCDYLEKTMGYGRVEFWSRSKLQIILSQLKTDVLVIVCHLMCSDSIAAKVPFFMRDVKAISDMRSILEKGKRSDFTLKLKDREWPVHKVILESRCEYFENMFRHDWVENTVGEVKFDDIEKDALDNVLQFIYTGVVEDMSIENVCEVYVAAQKFLLNNLKDLCAEFIKSKMCDGIVCKVLVIADTYEAEDLNERAIQYCMQEAIQTFESKEWKELKKNHPLIAAELLEEIIKRERKEE